MGSRINLAYEVWWIARLRLFKCFYDAITKRYVTILKIGWLKNLKSYFFQVSQLRNRGIFKAGLDDRSSNDSPKINSYWKQLKAAAPFLQPTHRCLPEPPSSFFLFFETWCSYVCNWVKEALGPLNWTGTQILISIWTNLAYSIPWSW